VNKATLLAEIKRLPEIERLELMVDIWESVPADGAWPNQDQVAEARRRLEAHRRNPETAIAAEQVLARLQLRFG